MGAAITSCSSDDTVGASGSTSGAGGGSTGATTSVGTGPTGSGGAFTGPFSDFPATPIVDMPAGGQSPPDNVASLFGPEGSGDMTGGPCLLEPPPGSLVPHNWVRPRFVWTAAAGQNVFELRIKAANETNELVVYTTATQWTMPKAMWTALTTDIPDVPMTVTIRGGVLQGAMLAGSPAVGTSGTLTIAPADAAGSIVYWRTVKADNTGELKGFSAGDESVVLALSAPTVQVKPGGQSVTCIGCHTSTPDGKFAAFKTLGGTNGGAMAGVAPGLTGQPPGYWSAAAIAAMNASEFGVPSFSKAHFTDGDRVLVTSWGNNQDAALVWFDLQAASAAQGVAFDVIPRTGDPNGAVMPSFSHDGKTIVYISTNNTADGRASGDGDIYTMPYANRMGGAATPLQGASDPTYNEYYPALSPDDRLVAFNRVAAGIDPYNQPAAEIFVVPATGGSATRLDANDPVACSGTTSPGVTNSWPKWAPEAVQVGDRTFYWLAFSSTRGGSVPQLYVTALVEKGGQLTSYPAVHIWPQPADEANHTPAWDVFEIPPPMPK